MMIELIGREGPPDNARRWHSTVHGAFPEHLDKLGVVVYFRLSFRTGDGAPDGADCSVLRMPTTPMYYYPQWVDDLHDLPINSGYTFSQGPASFGNVQADRFNSAVALLADRPESVDAMLAARELGGDKAMLEYVEGVLRDP